MRSIVIDKCVLRACSKTRLQGFFATHTAIIPHTLLFEISSAGDEMDSVGRPVLPSYCNKMKALIGTGYFGQNSTEMIAEEFRTKRPVEHVLDLPLTVLGRIANPAPSHDMWRNPRKWWSEEYKLDYERETIGRLKSYTRLVAGGANAALSLGRIRQEYVDSGPEMIGRMARDVCEQCLISWPRHYPEAPSLARRDSFKFIEYVLINTLNLSRAINNIQGGAGNERSDHDLFNDWMDVHYICFLVRADGILSKDVNLCRLAKALFREKEVWFYKQAEKEFVLFGEQT
jgi:hypothetical protein